MTLSDLVDNWDEISTERREQALDNLIKLIRSDFDKYEELAFDLIAQAEMWESDDYFGEEGIQV